MQAPTSTDSRLADNNWQGPAQAQLKDELVFNWNIDRKNKKAV